MVRDRSLGLVYAKSLTPSHLRIPPLSPPHFPKSARSYSQFQQRQIGITVVRLVLALLGNIFLEDLRGLWIISVEAVEDGVDVFGPVGAVVEGGHRGGACGC